MASPVLPSDFEDCIVDGDDSLADAFVKVFIRLPILLYKFVAWIIDDSGLFTQEYSDALCAINCDSEETTE